MESSERPPLDPFESKEYLQDSYKFESVGRVLQTRKSDKAEGTVLVLLDKTIFHPQGGGQPEDTGELRMVEIGSEGYEYSQYQQVAVVPVQGLEYDKMRDEVWLQVSAQKAEAAGMLKEGAEVRQVIDEAKRRMYARLHSGGHLMDSCVARLGLKWLPVKGYHFPDGPYVEYSISQDAEALKIPQESAELADKLTQAANDIIQHTTAEERVQVAVYDYEAAKKEIEIPPYIPQGKRFRYLRLHKADKGIPCGGTHVKHLQDIGRLVVTKLTKKGKNVRLSYRVEDK